MDELIHICRSIANTENAVQRLNKNVAKLTKYCRMTNVRVTGVAIAGLLVTAVIAIQCKEIEALKEEVACLKIKTKTHSTTEGQTAQKGA